MSPIPTLTDLEAARAKVANELSVDVLKGVDLHKTELALARNFTSDTITYPTDGMIAYAMKASRGDDVFKADQCTVALEAHIAQITGKEAALFCASGTMTNQLAIRTHLLSPPHSVLCDARAHVHRNEAGGIAHHSQATTLPVMPENGHHLTVKDVKAAAILSEDVHLAPTRLISLENTLNGTILPQDEIVAISQYARSSGIKMHLDGARIWNVAAETGASLHELCEPFDSVSLCLSKGIGAPIGSMLVGNREFISRARWFRKMFGGGWRQSGYLAAAAAYALTHNFPLLSGTHALARKLEAGLRDIGVGILCSGTNMVFFDARSIGVNYDELVKRALALPEPLYLGGSRLVIHYQTSEKAVNDLLDLIQVMANEKRAEGFVPGVLEQQPADAYYPKMKEVFIRSGTKAVA
ncbi:threonine aldolase [Dacryopinax primogenitus]|uniref:Threonine aldolase n=1 Tax=Dacryopinax primogenitus (strain DJM 731) TaxID=1858805 RepID=M5FQU2_DACPD|nr:threonine aldolase [Dacryopinax primogenitus]EJT97948.1 threonine aldolase [Dacryopinax primogenitus]